MGASQSQPGRSAALALWAEDNDISPEAISEAYGLGARDNSLLTASAVRPNEGLAPDFEVGKYIAIDCEMVGIGEGGYAHALARVSIVDFHGRQVYDSYARPEERVVDWRTRISGIAPKHMATAREFADVQTQVAQLLHGRILVGHDLKHDLDVLMLDHPRKDIRDTAKFSGFKKYGHGPKPALRVLAREILGVNIQTGQHSSIEDARVAMLLFRRYKPAFDVEHASRYPDFVPKASESKPKAKPKKTKKKRRN
ncbi:putative rna exonuclease 4 [Diaporthe ampelina]|uniref:RNA exonuclease 4 n=1 Tax=Diaporthe ampelina TaxID=1214573 RepID=A0A0G2FN55_9PEZI|nr:putative rna exonuclease 4 [Diaporthe ampelina]